MVSPTSSVDVRPGSGCKSEQNAYVFSLCASLIYVFFSVSILEKFVYLNN
mgnify:CR=1 FL=1